MTQTRWDEMRAECQAYHDRHPRVWELFKRFTFDRIGRGFHHYSVNAVFERIRWETDQARGASDAMFKINNNHRPFYARRFMTAFPQHAGFFRIREQLSKEQRATGLPPLGPGDFPNIETRGTEETAQCVL